MKSNDEVTICLIQTAFIGDVALVLHSVSALRFYYPNAKIIVVTTKVAASIVELSPDVNIVIPFDKRKKDKGLRGLLQIIKKIKLLKPEILFAPHRSARTSLISFFSCAPLRISFSTSSLKFLYNKIIVYKSFEHEILRNARLLAAIIPHPAEKISLFRANLLSLYSKDQLDNKFPKLRQVQNSGQCREIILIAPGSVWATKRWKKEKFVQVVSSLSQKYVVCLIGGFDEIELCSSIEGDLHRINPQTIDTCLNLAGKTTFKDLLSIMKISSLVITNDSAPTHLAGLVSVPVITIYGPTIPEFGFAPTGKNDIVVQMNNLECRPCSPHGTKTCPLGHHQCMDLISSDEVLQAAYKILNKENYELQN